MLLNSASLAAQEGVWTLPKALQHAQEHNPNARLAAHRIATSQAMLRQANAAFWPRLDVHSGYRRTDKPSQVFGNALNQRSFSSDLDFNDVPDSDDFNVGGILSVPLYEGGRNIAAHQSARASKAASEAEAAAVSANLAYEVVRTYHEIQKARAFIRTSEATVNSFEANVATARQQFHAGTLLKTGLLDLEVKLAQAREDLVKARNALKLAKRAFAHLLGLEQATVQVDDALGPVSAPTSPAAADRPELRAARQRNLAAKAEVRRRQGERLPHFRAFGGYDYDKGWEFGGDGHSWTVGVAMQWNLWDAGLERAKVKEAEANAEAAAEQWRKERLAVEWEVTQAESDYETSRERLIVTEKAVALAVESTQLTRSRFQQGLALASEVIDAETALTSARMRRIEAETGERIASAALRRALGLPQITDRTP